MTDPLTHRRAWLGDMLARSVVGALFLAFAANLLTDFIHTGRVTGLLLLASESLVAVFTVLRRQAIEVDRSPMAIAVTIISLTGPPLLRASAGGGLVPDLVTVSVSAVGLLIVIGGKMTLGRSFGIVPANRGVVIGGPYAFVRHPIYAGYLLTHIAFVAANPTLENIVIAMISDVALVTRAFFEERTLSHDDRYQAYCQRVAWHLVPGVF